MKVKLLFCIFDNPTLTIAFAEISLLLEERRVANVDAIEICDMYVLYRKDFEYVLGEYPRLKKVLHHIAMERLEALNKESESDV